MLAEGCYHWYWGSAMTTVAMGALERTLLIGEWRVHHSPVMWPFRGGGRGRARAAVTLAASSWLQVRLWGLTQSPSLLCRLNSQRRRELNSCPPCALSWGKDKCPLSPQRLPQWPPGYCCTPGKSGNLCWAVGGHRSSHSLSAEPTSLGCHEDPKARER